MSSWKDIALQELKRDLKAALRTIEVVTREAMDVERNLTATQQRCNKLLEENRALKAKLKLEMT